jgi:hypothetical protein
VRGDDGGGNDDTHPRVFVATTDTRWLCSMAVTGAFLQPKRDDDFANSYYGCERLARSHPLCHLCKADYRSRPLRALRPMATVMSDFDAQALTSATVRGGGAVLMTTMNRLNHPTRFTSICANTCARSWCWFAPRPPSVELVPLIASMKGMAIY